MPIDSNIALGYRAPEFANPVNQLAQVLQVQGLQQQQDLHRMQADEARRGIADTNALNKLYQTAIRTDGSIDRNALYSGAAQGGLGSKIPGLAKGFAEQDKATAEVDHKKLETAHKRMDIIGQGTGWLKNNPTMQNAQAMVNHWVQVGVIDAAQAQQKLAEFQRDPTPEGIARYATMGYQAALSAKDQLPSFETRNLGGTTDTLRRNPVTGAVEVVNSAKNTQSPDSAASSALGYAKLNEDKRHHGVTEGHAGEANRLKGQEVQNATGSGLPVLGVPAPTVTPWANQSNPKDANKVKAAEMARGSKEVEKDADAASKSRATAQDAQRFVTLNEKVSTGGLMDKTGAGRWVGSFGADQAEMEAITARLAPAMRAPGSGSSSDYDGKQFERATVGVDKPKAANKNIAAAIVTRAQQEQDYAEYRQTYLEQNGTLQGSERYWKQYVDKNPIFDPKKSGTFELNPSRKGWREHFAGKSEAKPADSPAPAPAAPTALPAGWTVKVR